MHVSSEHYGVSVLYSTVFLIFALKLGFLSGAAAASPQVFGSWVEKMKTELHMRISFALMHSSRSEAAFGLLDLELFSTTDDQKQSRFTNNANPQLLFIF